MGSYPCISSKKLREFLIRPISTTDDFSTFLSMHIKLHVIFDLSKIKWYISLYILLCIIQHRTFESLQNILYHSIPNSPSHYIVFMRFYSTRVQGAGLAFNDTLFLNNCCWMLIIDTIVHLVRLLLKVFDLSNISDLLRELSESTK